MNIFTLSDVDLPFRIEVCGSYGGLESTELGGIGTGVAGNALSLARGLMSAARVPPAAADVILINARLISRTCICGGRDCDDDETRPPK